MLCMFICSVQSFFGVVSKGFHGCGCFFVVSKMILLSLEVV